MRIRELRCFQVSGPATIEASEERQLQMLDVYPELARRGPGTGNDRVNGTYVEGGAHDGTNGSELWRMLPDLPNHLYLLAIVR